MPYDQTSGKALSLTEAAYDLLPDEQRAAFDEFASAHADERKIDLALKAAGQDVRLCMQVLDASRDYLLKLRPPLNAVQAAKMWIEGQRLEAARARGEKA